MGNVHDYLYPEGKVRPIEARDGYRDYRLSNILHACGRKMHAGGLRFASGPTKFMGDFPCTETFMVADVRISEDRKEYIAFAPLGYYRPISRKMALEYSGKEMMWPRYFYDLRIRYYLDDGKPRRPVWVSSYVNKPKRVVVRGDYGHWRSTYPLNLVEYASGYGVIDGAPDLLVQPFIQRGDTASSFHVESSRIRYCE